MGERAAVQSPPYSAVQQLASWAVINAEYLRGRLLLAGWRPGDLAADELIDVAYAVLVDSVVGLGDRTKLLEALRVALATPPVPSRAQHGRHPQAVAGHRATMALAGGPAPRRPDAPGEAAG